MVENAANEGWFTHLCTALDTAGGHMIVCVILIMLGAGIELLGLREEGKGLIAAAGGAVLMAMRGVKDK